MISAGPGRHLLRAALLLLASVGPMAGFSLRAAATGNAEQAIDGLLWGAPITLAALVGFAMTFRAAAIARLGWFALGLLGILLAWGLVIGISNA